jgi:hypothetical protein
MTSPQTIAFFTGQSRPGCCALSPEQARFLAELGDVGGERVWKNFPYRAAGVHQDVPLLRASWRNVRGYLASRRTGFAETYRSDVSALIARSERTVFLAGSSGLELFNNLGLAEHEERKCLLICYGPVARRLPRHAQVHLVLGSRDMLSRLYFPRLPPALSCGHMDYLRQPPFLELCRSFLARPVSPPCSNISA